MLKKNLAFLALAFFCLVQAAPAQPAERRYSRKEYIERWKDEAINQMNMHNIPASITLAQGILESADGNSPLARYANNHFGIKCAGWTGETFIQDDDARDECFRKYDNAEESYVDHSLFLKKPRYADLFTLAVTDYKGWAHGLKKAGYATSPQYAPRLIQIIEENNLQNYDREPVYAQKPVVAPPKEVVTNIKARKHEVKVHDNNIRYVIAKQGDTPYKIATEFDMGLWQIYKYNDLESNAKFNEGDIVYLQPKRSKAKFEFHTMAAGDNMKKISQLYGVKLKKLYKRNRITPGKEPAVGTVIYLSKSVN